MATVKVEQSVVEYLVDGTGPGLVLVHGTGGSAEANWGHLVGRFSKHWTVVRPNYSGSGNTMDAGGPLSVKQLAEQVLGAAEAAGKTPFNLVGFSLGAVVAAVVASRAADLVRSVVLIAGFPDSTDSYLRLEFSLWRDIVALAKSTGADLIVLGVRRTTSYTINLTKNVVEIVLVEAKCSVMTILCGLVDPSAL